MDGQNIRLPSRGRPDHIEFTDLEEKKEQLRNVIVRWIEATSKE